MGEAAEPALRNTRREGRLSLEMDRRVSVLMEKLASEWLRTERAVEALELAETPEAIQVLEALGKGNPEARLTLEARAALGRSRGNNAVSRP